MKRATAGIRLMMLATLVSPWIVFLALPPFQIGVWTRLEPVAIGLHLCAALGAVGLALASPSSLVRRPLVGPVMVICAISLLWGLGIAPFVSSLGAHWFGAPETHQGLAWFVDVAVLVACAQVLYVFASIRRQIVLSAFLSLGVLCVLSLMYSPQWSWSPYPFLDHLAFYGLFCGALAAVTPWRHQWQRAVLISLALLVIVISKNHTAVVSVIGAIAAGFVVSSLRSRFVIRWTMAVLAGVTPILILGACYVALESSYAAVGQPLSSLRARWLLADVVLSTVQAEPQVLALGRGWGTYTDALLAQAPLDHVDLVSGPNGSPDWDALQRVDFHAHSEAVEALLAGGVVALGLWLAFLALPALFGRERSLRVAGIAGLAFAGLAGSWFQYPGSIPFMACAYGFMISGRLRCPKLPIPRARVAVGVLSVLALVQSASALALFDVARQASQVRRGADRQLGCAVLSRDYGRAGVHLAVLLHVLQGELREKEQNAPLLAADIERLDALMCASTKRLDAGADTGVRLAVIDILARAQLAFPDSPSELDALRERYLSDWGRRASELLLLAPGRSDLVASYFYYALAAGDVDKVLALSQRILAGLPNDSVAQWFQGLALIENPRTAPQGLRALRQALVGGVERYTFIDPQWKTLLLNSQ